MRQRQLNACNALENELIASKEALKGAEKLQQMQQESFDKQLEAVKAQLSAETEKLLQQREEALQKKAEETFRTLPWAWTSRRCRRASRRRSAARVKALQA